MCAASKYQYKPLYDDQATTTGPIRQLPIRLLRLLRGDFIDDIRVELEEAWVDELEALGPGGTFFDALSYVWGSRDNLATVWIGIRRCR